MPRDEVVAKSRDLIVPVLGPETTTQLIDAVLHRQLFKRRRAFRKQNQVQRIVRPVGQGNLDQLHANFLHRLQRRSIYFGCGTFLHPAGKISHAQAFHACIRVEVEMTRHARRVSRIWPGDCL